MKYILNVLILSLIYASYSIYSLISRLSHHRHNSKKFNKNRNFLDYQRDFHGKDKENNDFHNRNHNLKHFNDKIMNKIRENRN